MPKTGQGDIFEATARVQLAIVFGRIGFNEMGQKMVLFCTQPPQAKRRKRPFHRTR